MASLDANPHRNIKYFNTLEDIARTLTSSRHKDIRDKFVFLKITNKYGFETTDKSQSFSDFLSYIVPLKYAEIIEMPDIELFCFAVKAESYNLYISRYINYDEHTIYSLISDLNNAFVWQMQSQKEMDAVLTLKIQPYFDIPLNSLILSKVPKFI